MRSLTFPQVASRFAGKTVAIVGSGPGVLSNKPGFVDSHDVICRVNNYVTGDAQGRRTDVHYAFYGHSIRKTAEELKRDGATLCICKCPDSKPLVSAWHEERGKQNGIDFRYIYRARDDFWFCDTYVPDDARFMRKFDLLEGHIPTTGFSAIFDILECNPARVHLTGFDFFRSGIHNVNQRWLPGDTGDPIGHRPDLEAKLLAKAVRAGAPFTLDRPLKYIMRELNKA